MVRNRLYIISGMNRESSDAHIKAILPIKNQTKLQHGTSPNGPQKRGLHEIIVFESLNIRKFLNKES